MSRHGQRRSRSLVDQLADTYLRTRLYLGLGLMSLTVLVVALGVGGESIWVVPLAGAVIVGHTLAGRAMDMNDPNVALMIDLTATMTAALILARANSNQTPILLTYVGASVLIALFSERLVRVLMLAYVAAFGFSSLLMVTGWDVSLALGDYIGAVVLAALVISVVAVIKHRIFELEATKAQTLAVVGHELRNHLAGVVAAVELVRGGDLGPDDQDEMLELTYQQAVEAIEVIEDLLVASRAERGQLDSIPDNIDLCPITETIIRRTSLDTGEIKHDLSGRHVWAVADPLRYGQVVRNLLTNALRYGGDEIRVSVAELEGLVSVVVADNGDGVDPAALPHLFHPFHGDSRDDPVPDSHGLGLWISRGLAQAMGGDLTYSRNSGQTIFELTLPAGHGPAAGAEEPGPIRSMVG